MERYELCLFQLSESDWLGMPMKSWDISEYDVLTAYSKDSTGGGYACACSTVCGQMHGV